MIESLKPLIEKTGNSSVPLYSPIDASYCLYEPYRQNLFVHQGEPVYVCAVTGPGHNQNVTYYIAGQQNWNRFAALESLGTVIQESTDDSIGSVLRRLDELINDNDQYEGDESPPSQATIRTTRSLLRSMAHVGYPNLPRTYISIYYGEISISWKTDRNLVRLTFRPDGSIELYRQADYRDSARGESMQVTVHDNQQVAAYIRWLSEDTRAANPVQFYANR
jgi:hypothetical protein